MVTSGSAEASEYAGIEVWSGKLVLNDSRITVSTDKIRYSNSILGIGIQGGEVTMNGGAITIKSHGSTKTKYDYVGAVFAGGSAEKVVNLNGVEISMLNARGELYGESAKYLFAWGGHTILNTTDVVTDTDVRVLNGGTYAIQ